ncbi:MAG: CotH kinase family protein [Gracilimonas sp.]|nr:CotH kinase family protein [Gracilimonas sp.]
MTKVVQICYSITLLITLWLSSVAIQAQTIQVSSDSGFFKDSVTVYVQTYPDTSQAYFTLDGSEPTVNSPVVMDSVTIYSTSAFRVATFSPDFSMVTRTYFINEESELPVVAITTAPDNLFSAEKGIYVEGNNGTTGYCSSSPKNWNQDWERPVRLELFEKNREEGFSIDAGIKIGGGCTRLYDQKSLDIYFRGDYGAKKLNYNVFEDKPINEFDRLSLRSGGQDWYRAIIRNAAAQSMVRNRMNLGYQAFKPAAVFINGNYWGIHILREKQNEDFLESNYGYNEDEIDILKNNASVKEGSSSHYDEMITFIENNDLSVDEHYEWVAEQMDIDQYIDYQIAQIYWANGDWPGGNIIFWRPQEPDAKWKWLLYDVDMSMGSHSRGQFDTNMLEKLAKTTNTNYEHPAWSTFLFRSLLTNPKFKNKFIQRYSMHMHTTFQPDRMMTFIDSTAGLIESEIPRHMDRWDKALRLGYNMNWEKHLGVIEDFIRKRPNQARTNLYDFFDLIRLNSLETKVSPANAGKVYIENVRSDKLEYGLVYNSVPVNIRAEANPGYKFTGWSGSLTGSNGTKTQVTIIQNTTLTARFERSEISESGIVINEVNYNAADNFDTEDWVEFYNNSSESVDMSGWYFSDSDDSHVFTFPERTVLNSDTYLVLTADNERFETYFPNVNNKVGDMDFGLSGSGELIRLFDADDKLVDHLTYSDEFPWPIEADGEGSTLSLSNPGFDNTEGLNWAASTGNGTPGQENSDILVSNKAEEIDILPESIAMEQNYPNPFNPETTISYSIAEQANVTLKVYDSLGRLVTTLVNGYKAPGQYQVSWNASGHSSGVYIYRLEGNGESITKRLMLIK